MSHNIEQPRIESEQNLPLLDESFYRASRPTHEDYRRDGEAAYDRAMALEDLHGLNEPSTIEAYRDASTNLINVSFTVPVEAGALTVEDDPVRLLMIAGSLAKQAEAEYVEPYSEEGLIHPDKADLPSHLSALGERRKWLMESAMSTFKRAGEMLVEAEGFELVLDGEKVEVEVDNPVGLIAEVAIEAAKDTAEYPAQIAPGSVFEEEAERLQDTEDLTEVVEFFKTHAKGQQGPEFTADAADLLKKELEEAADHQFHLAA